jgi:hypothetical protein
VLILTLYIQYYAQTLNHCDKINTITISFEQKMK